MNLFRGMNISLSHILYVLIIFQLFFLSLFLLTQVKGKRISNIMLGLFFLVIALNLLDFFLFQTGNYSANIWLTGWGSCLPLLFGPLIYLYTQSVLDKDFLFNREQWKHFIPFFIICAGTEIYFHTQSPIDQRRIMDSLLRHQVPGAVAVISNLIFIQFLIYIMASFRLISRFRKNAKQFFSNQEQHNMQWLSSMILFFLLIVVMIILNGLLTQTVLASYYLIVFNMIVFAMLIFVMTVFLKALKTPYFLSFSFDDDPQARTIASAHPRFPETESAERERIIKLLVDYMEQHKPFMEPELTLDQLAGRLAVKPRVFSQAINEGLGQNFYDFINRYRILEAKQLLTNPKDPKITVLEVLYEVGFNSKSSFNTLFKKYTGLTPTEFRRKQQP